VLVARFLMSLARRPGFASFIYLFLRDMSAPEFHAEWAFYLMWAYYFLGCSFHAGGSMKNRLKLIREERGYSQEQLGEMLEVSRQTINSIENKRYDPSLPLAFKVARLFKVPIEEIFIYEEK
jgi:putative transcriptional regulator